MISSPAAAEVEGFVQDIIPEPTALGDTENASVPGYYWAVAVVGFLWNCIGVYFYMMAKLDPQTTIAGMPSAMQDYVLNMPLWAHVGWSLGIWGSFIGSILMLQRRRQAIAAFLVSLLGALASFTAQAKAGVLTPAEPIMVLTIIGILLWFCRRSREQGLLN